MTENELGNRVSVALLKSTTASLHMMIKEGVRLPINQSNNNSAFLTVVIFIQLEDGLAKVSIKSILCKPEHNY